MDLSKLSDSDLALISKGDMRMVSDQGLQMIAGGDTEAPVTAKPYDVNPGVASLMNVGQAATFGFGDELASLVGADKERYRATVKNFRENYPGSALTGSIAGSMVLPFGAAKAAVNPWLTAATVGGLAGGLTGAGESDSGTAAGTTKDAAMGLIVGSIGGPALMLGVKPAGMLADVIGKQAGSRLPWVGDKLSNILARQRVSKAFERDNVTPADVSYNMSKLGPEARIADAAGDSTRGLLDLNATLPGKTSNALEAAIEMRQIGRPGRLDPVVNRVGDNKGRAGEVFANWQTEKEKAAGPLYARFRAQKIAPDPELQKLLDIAENTGLFPLAKERATFETAGGGAPFSLIGKAESGKTIFIDRAGQIVKDLKVPPVPQTRSLLNELKKSGGINTSELSDLNVEGVNTNYPGLATKNGKSMDGIVEWMTQHGWIDDNAVAMADRNNPGGSHELARDMIKSALNREPVIHPVDGDAVYAHNQFMTDLEAQGINQVKIPGTPLPTSYKPSDLDYLKRALDSKIEKAAANGDNDAIRSMMIFKKALVDKVDKASGGTYRPALDAFAGPAGLQSALTQGRTAFTGNMTAETMADLMTGMSSSEKEAFRIGASESLRQKFGAQSGQTELLGTYKNRNLQEKFNVILGHDASYREVMDMLNNERTLKKFESLGRGSQTARREAGAEDQTMGVAADALGLGVAAKTGAWPALLSGVNKYSSRLGTPEPVRDSIGSILLSKNTDEELKAIIAAQKAMRERAAFGSALSGQGAGSIPAVWHYNRK